MSYTYDYVITLGVIMTMPNDSAVLALYEIRHTTISSVPPLPTVVNLLFSSFSDIPPSLTDAFYIGDPNLDRARKKMSWK